MVGLHFPKTTMNTRPSARFFGALSVSLLLAGAAQAATYTTQFDGTNDPLNAFQVGRIELVWTTTVPVGNPVGVADLSDLTFSFYDNSNILVYTDNTIVGGIVQPIGGIARPIDDIVFSATSGVSIQALDNDLDQKQFNVSASGTTYNMYSSIGGSGPVINLARYLNGAFTSDATFNITGQTTAGAIPEPSSYAALAGLVGLGFVAARRKRS